MVFTLIGFLLFVFFAIAGLIVDVGFARLTQRQMLNATDAAALEGVRLKDTVGTVAEETLRRDASRQALANHFDDDFQETLTDAYQFGAGPLVTLGDGIGSIGAARQVVVDPTNRVYKPDAQRNLTDQPQGDLVEGAFDLRDRLHVENRSYDRSDFAPGAGAEPGHNTIVDAFLARLRRTRGDNPLDSQAGVSSRGPAIPYLFAQGSLIAPEMRERGITVRSTSIAGARRATLVGLPDPDAGLPGYPPFLLDIQYWNSLPAGQTIRLRFNGDGQLVGSSAGANPSGGPPQPNPFFPYDDRGGPPIIPPGQINAGGEPIGMLADRLNELRRSWSIGDNAVPSTARSIDQIFDWLGNPDADDYVPGKVYFFVPIYEGVVSWDGRPGRQPGEAFKEGDPRVVGYGTVAIAAGSRPANNGNSSSPEIEIVKLPSYIAPFNASAVQTPGLAGNMAATIMEQYKLVDEPLRAAALVR